MTKAKTTTTIDMINTHDYTVEQTQSDRQTQIHVTDANGARAFTATVHYAKLNDVFGAPQRAAVNWQAIGPANPKLADVAGRVIQLAANLAKESDKRPLDFNPKYIYGPEQKVIVDSPEFHEQVEKRRNSQRAAMRWDAENAWVYSNSARYDWDLGEAVYGIGIGASVLYDVPESLISPKPETTA